MTSKLVATLAQNIWGISPTAQNNPPFLHLLHPHRPLKHWVHSSDISALPDTDITLHSTQAPSDLCI